MSQTTPIHFDLNNTPVRFHDYLLHGCDKISPLTDRQMDKSGEILKTASALVPATKCVSRTTFCHHDTHTHRLIGWEYHQLTLSQLVNILYWPNGHFKHWYQPIITQSLLCSFLMMAVISMSSTISSIKGVQLGWDVVAVKIMEHMIHALIKPYG